MRKSPAERPGGEAASAAVPSTEPVTFYLPDHPHIHRLDSIDPDREWRVFEAGRDQWIPYTYIRLKQAGHDVRVSAVAPEHGVVVAFAADLTGLLDTCARRADLTVVGVQADRRIPELLLADVLIQHNGNEADDRRRFFIPNWPQAGLTARDGSRPERVETIAYKGRLLNLAPMFLSEAWNEFLATRDLQFRIETDNSEPAPAHLPMSNITVDRRMRWNDYSDVDLVLAVRPIQADLHPHKPALKLTNAWHAGVPALLGPEIGYRELRTSPLDYAEVATLPDAMGAVDRLLDDGALYGQMIEHGSRRAAEFDVASILGRWEGLLFGYLADWTPHPLSKRTRRLLAPARRLGRRTRRTLDRVRSS